MCLQSAPATSAWNQIYYIWWTHHDVLISYGYCLRSKNYVLDRGYALFWEYRREQFLNQETEWGPTRRLENNSDTDRFSSPRSEAGTDLDSVHCRRVSHPIQAYKPNLNTTWSPFQDWTPPPHCLELVHNWFQISGDWTPVYLLVGG